MLTDALLFLAAASGISTALVLLPGVVRVRLWLSLPLALGALALASWLAYLLTGDTLVIVPMGALTLVLVVAVRIRMRQWSVMAAEVMALFALAAGAFVAYAVVQTARFAFNPAWLLMSLLLLAMEVAALFLAISYAFEMLDVLSRRPASDDTRIEPAPGFTPRVAIQVPTYNEPVEVVRPTLESLARLDYPNYLVQVVDNNTTDPGVWRPLERICQKLGPKFQFIHLEDWPGYKAGALNEATRRLPLEVEIVGVVDADYVVEPGFLNALVPAFADPRVAIAQSPQNYRDWEDDRYLRGLYFSYRYFFDVTMRSRAHRNAIIFCGTMGLLRRSAMQEVGGWSEDCVTEDAEASLRLLGHGYTAVYDDRAWGSGLMPLSFAGLRSQRYRWALGGMQILKKHWRELLPGVRHRLPLTRAQRIHYLLGSVQWLGDPLTAAFTLLVSGTALGIAMHHRLPVRQLTGAVIAVPVIFLATGLMRALWSLRRTSGATTGDAVRALRVWFALSWTVTLACLAGLFRSSAVFLRTPKVKEGQASFFRALMTSRVEVGLVLLTVGSATAMLVAAPTVAFAALALMLLFEAGVYASAPWASLAAEGIQMTPLRELYGRSPQSTGERPMRATALMAAPAALAVLAAVAVASLLVAAPPNPGPASPPQLPQIGSILGGQPSPSPSPSPSTPASAPAAAPSTVSSSTPSAGPPATPSASAPAPSPSSP